MSVPSWPRLVGWMSTAELRPARGAWRSARDGRERSGSFAFRPPEDWLVVDSDGALVDDGDVRRLWSEHEWERRDDYHRAAGPVVAVEHAGRPCWQVSLEPPARKSGLLTLVVDDATGLCLRMANDEHGLFHEVVALELDVDLPQEVFAPLLARRAEADRVQARFDLCHSSPPPTPRWFPWRSTHVWEDELVELRGWRGEGSVGRAPLGQEAPATEWVPSVRVVRLDHGGWSWAVATGEPLDEPTARRVVEQVVELPD